MHVVHSMCNVTELCYSVEHEEQTPSLPTRYFSTQSNGNRNAEYKHILCVRVREQHERVRE